MRDPRLADCARRAGRRRVSTGTSHVGRDRQLILQSKSQLAIEYAYHAQDRSPEMWVFWAHASNAARFEQSFRDIADYVKLAGRQDLQVNIFKLVHNWLHKCKQPWLLVLDNVDDARLLLQVEASG